MYATTFTDYYETLQIPFGAEAAEIKTAYRKLALEQHPDRHPEDTEHYTRRFQEITEAYNVLSDPGKKARYDMQYRETILGEGPQYMVLYQEDTAPPDTREYKHKYTTRNRRRFSIVPIGMGIVLLFQVLRLLTQASPVFPDSKGAAGTSPEQLQQIIRQMNAHPGGDSDVTLPGTAPVAKPLR
ncbi:J domain-containing protein [Taibaiella koreensis]|uniref:J domain-containing protein n=1 Tax=Taibaiella koreensis TaxID=1268548 RepID=UPI000E59BBD1|nr:DnaJ domain-containing protein [Taibaiella koreensis]